MVEIHINARAKQTPHGDTMLLSRTVVLDSKALAGVFTLTLRDAAKELGVCATSLKTYAGFISYCKTPG